jgi:hypothetical protein
MIDSGVAPSLSHGASLSDLLLSYLCHLPLRASLRQSPLPVHRPHVSPSRSARAPGLAWPSSSWGSRMFLSFPCSIGVCLPRHGAHRTTMDAEATPNGFKRTSYNLLARWDRRPGDLIASMLWHHLGWHLRNKGCMCIFKRWYMWCNVLPKKIKEVIQ